MNAVASNVLSNIEHYEKLLPVTRQLYEHTSALSWQMLLPLFLLSVAMGYSTDLGLSGAIVIRLKRLVLVALLLVAFPTIAEFLQSLGTEIAKSIDDMTGIDMILDAASKKAESYSLLGSILNLNADMSIGILALISFLILMIARYLLLAFQHFYWLLMIVLAPFMILAMLFESSSGVTKNLFKNMIQIAAWPIIWSVLSAFLKAIPFASIYETDGGGYLTIVTLNLILAVALLYSPFLVSQLCDGVSLSVGDTLRKGALKAVSVAVPKAAVAINAINRADQVKKFTNK